MYICTQYSDLLFSFIHVHTASVRKYRMRATGLVLGIERKMTSPEVPPGWHGLELC